MFVRLALALLITATSCQDVPSMWREQGSQIGHEFDSDQAQQLVSLGGRQLSSLKTCKARGQEIRTMYYELNVTLNAKDKRVINQCSEEQLRYVGQIVEGAIADLRLHQKYLGIVDIKNHICEEGSVDAKRNDDRRELTSWYISSRYMYFYIFRGGGRCMYCFRDNFDHYRQLTNLEQSTKLLRGSTLKAIAAENHTVSTISSQGRRLRKSCGCQTLDFSVRRDGRATVGTPYIDHKEYSWRYGMNVFVAELGENDDGDKVGYAPNKSARLFDSSLESGEPSHFDTDLGSPNEACGGPGVGKGGAPKIDGKKNPGANCEPQGHVLIIQNQNTDIANDSSHGGIIEFKATHGTVHLKEVGLLDINKKSVLKIKVYYKNSENNDDNASYYPVGYGQNSFETVKINRKRVFKIHFIFKAAGSISYIKYCHEGGNAKCDDKDVKTASSAQDSTDSDTVIFEESMIPNIENYAELAISTAILKESFHNPNFCLKETHVIAEVDMTIKQKDDLNCAPEL